MVIRAYTLDMEYTGRIGRLPAIGTPSNGQQNWINYCVAMVIRVYSLDMEYTGRIGRPASHRNT